MTSLLNKSAKDRITARDSLKHPFMLLYPSMTSHKRHVQFDRFNSRAMSLTASTRNGIPASGPSPSPSPSPLRVCCYATLVPPFCNPPVFN